MTRKLDSRSKLSGMAGHYDRGAFRVGSSRTKLTDAKLFAVALDRQKMRFRRRPVSRWTNVGFLQVVLRFWVDLGLPVLGTPLCPSYLKLDGSPYPLGLAS